MRWRTFFLPFAMLLVASIAVTARAGLVNYWNFDSNGVDSATGNSGSLIGDTTITNVAGEYAVGSGALKIGHNTSTGDYFDVDYEVFPSHSVYTVTGWYKWDESFSSEANDDRGFLYETTPDYSSGIGVYTDEFIPTFWAHGLTSTISANQFGSAINDGGWHFFAVSYDTVNDTAAYYHDGYAYSYTSAPQIIPTNGLHIGNHRSGNGTRNWKGFVDDFAVYEGIVSESDIESLYYGSYTPQTVPVDDSYVPDPLPPVPPVPTGRPVAYWSFDSDYSSAVHNDLYQGIPEGNDTGTFTSIDTTGVAVRGPGALKLDSGSDVYSGNKTHVHTDTNGPGVVDSEKHKQVSVSSWFRVEDISGDGSDERRFIYETHPN